MQLCEFSDQLGKSLMFANKPAPRGQPSNHRSIEAAPNYRQSKADAVPTLGHDVQHDGMAHWLEAVDKKY